MNLTSDVMGGALVVRVGRDRIDAAVCIRFKDQMRELVADGPPRVILDLSAVTFVDSSGLGAIVSVMKSLAPDRQLELAALMPNVDRVLRLTRIDTVIPIHLQVPGPDIADAV